MAVLSCKYADFDREASIGRGRQGTYKIVWWIETDGEADGPLIIMDEAGSVGPDQALPLGSFYQFMDDADPGSYMDKCTIRLRDKEVHTSYELVQTFSPLGKGEKPEHIAEPNPLLWVPVFWKEWVEEQVPIEKAICLGGKTDDDTPEEELTQLTQIARGVLDHSGNEPGPIVNAAGQQTVDPITEPKYHSILCCRRNFGLWADVEETNDAFFDTINDADIAINGHTYAKGTLRYMFSAASELMTKNVSVAGTPTAINYIEVTTKLEHRPKGWNKEIVNNGMVCFRKYEPAVYDSPLILGPSEGALSVWNGTYTLFPCIAATDLSTEGSASDTEDGEPAGPTPVSEPVNLTLQGTQATPEDKGSIIVYRHLDPADYSAIETLFDPTP